MRENGEKRKREGRKIWVIRKRGKCVALTPSGNGKETSHTERKRRKTSRRGKPSKANGSCDTEKGRSASTHAATSNFFSDASCNATSTLRFQAARIDNSSSTCHEITKETASTLRRGKESVSEVTGAPSFLLFFLLSPLFPWCLLPYLARSHLCTCRTHLLLFTCSLFFFVFNVCC